MGKRESSVTVGIIAVLGTGASVSLCLGRDSNFGSFIECVA